MRRLLPVLALSLTAALVACGNDNNTVGGPSGSASASSSPSASPSPTPVTLTRAQLDAVLLTAGDLGTGWTGDAPSDVDDEEGTPSPGASEADCDLDAMSRRLADPLYGREVGLSNLAKEILLSHQAEVYEPGDAAAAFTEVNATFGRCNTFTETDAESGEKSTLTKKPLDVGTYGDETFAITLTDEGEDGFTGGLVMVRRGDVVITVAGFSSEGTPTDDLRTAVQKAYAKLEAVLGGGTVATGTPAATGGTGTGFGGSTSPTASPTSS